MTKKTAILGLFCLLLAFGGAPGHAQPAAERSRALARTIHEAIEAARWAQAESLISALPEPRPPVVFYWLGRIRLGQGRLDEAETYLRQAITLRSDRPQWHHSLAKVLLEAGRCAAAIPVLEAALALAPEEADLHFDRAMCALNLRRTGLAEESLRALLRLSPQDPEAHLVLGKLLFDQGDAAAARAHLERGLEALPAAAEARFDLGLVYLELGDNDAARAAFVRVLESIPGHVGALYRLARLRPAVGEDAGAAIWLARYQEALKAQELIENRRAYLQLDPSSFSARGELIELLLAAGRGDEALEELRKARALVSDDPGLLKSLEVAYRRLGLADKADEIARLLPPEPAAPAEKNP